MIFEEKYDRKKIAILAVAIIAFLVAILVVIRIYQKARQTSLPTVNQPPVVTQPQESMMNALEKANKDMPAVSPDEQSQKEQDMADSLEKANNTGSTPSSEASSDDKLKDMLEALNEANKN